MSLLRLDPERDPLRILVVDDDEDDYVFVRDLIEETSGPSHEIEWAESYDAALEQLAERRHHLYLVDYRLGARTGVELLEEESLGRLPAPVVVLTGVGDRQADQAAMRAGASDFLTKGRIDAALLERTIRYAVEGKRQEEFQRFLADATRLLNASLEYETTVGAAARLVVPELADWSCVYAIGDDAADPTVEVVHSDPAQDLAARRLMELAPRWSPSEPVRDMMRGQKAVILDPVTEGRLDEWIQHDEYREAVAALGTTSTVAIPLRGKGGDFGVLVLASSDPARRYREADRLFFEDLGRRMAMAFENARLFEAAREATRVRDEILSMVSHDLGNPLAAVAIAAGRIRDRLDEGEREEIERYAEMIRLAADSMERLLDDLLEVGQIETGHFGIRRRPEDVARILEEIEGRFRPRAEKKGIEMCVGSTGPLPEVRVDRERVNQVLSNLVVNALKFTEEGGNVRIRAGLRDGEVRISVSDTGIGMSDDDLEHLFDRFWQARRHRRVGAGLGLTISKEIVEAHGGRIWAEGREGEGSTFFFTLPVEKSADPGSR